MAKKQSIVEKINSTQGTKTGKTLFGSSPYQNGFVMDEQVETNSENYNYTVVKLEDINECGTKECSNALRKSVLERVIQPVILSQEVEEIENHGMKYNRPTGRYNVIDGVKRIQILREDGRSAIQALVLPTTATNEEIERIKETVSADKTNGIQQVIRDVTETLDEGITYCYRYENILVDVDKLIERDNQYSMDQTGIDELEKSILHLGLLQPLVVLPVLDSTTLGIVYQIQSGHRRFRAIKQLIQHAKEGSYPGRKEIILETFKTVPALMIPMGSDKKDIEDIYNQTNMLARHMTVEDCFKVIESFENLPSRPTTKEEFTHFKEMGYSLSSLVAEVQSQLKRLGFKDWKNTKTSMFLNIYYYGSDKAREVFTNIDQYSINQKDVYWIVTTYKDFNERTMQDEILEKSLKNRSYLKQLKAEKTVRRNRSEVTIKNISDSLVSQRNVFEKYIKTTISGYASQDEKDTARKLINETRRILVQLEKAIENIQEEEEQ